MPYHTPTVTCAAFPLALDLLVNLQWRGPSGLGAHTLSNSWVLPSGVPISLSSLRYLRQNFEELWGKPGIFGLLKRQ